MQYNFFKETDWSGKGAWYYIWQQVELHLGIIAACLPAIKPLFANFFGQIRTLTKGRGTGSGISTPFRSNGYIQQRDPRVKASFAMMNVSEGSQQSKSRDPYDEDIILGQETYSVEAKGRLSRMRGVAGDSDESILCYEIPDRASHGQGRGLTIMKTTEVNITR